MKYCFNCGNKLTDGMKFCPECGQQLSLEEERHAGQDNELVREEDESTHARAKAQEKPREDMRSSTVTIERADPTYYSDDKGVRITSTRLIVGEATYSMANITSIKTSKTGPNYAVGIIAAVIGLVFVGLHGISSALAVIGVLLALGGIAFLLTTKPTFHLEVTSAAGEQSPLSSKDEKYIEKVAVALNEALIKRG